jgi:hypothetical protein
MSNSMHKPDPTTEDDSEGQGPNLFVLYALLMVGLLAAMAFAALVVLPFHHRH